MGKSTLTTELLYSAKYDDFCRIQRNFSYYYGVFLLMHFRLKSRIVIRDPLQREKNLKEFIVTLKIISLCPIIPEIYFAVLTVQFWGHRQLLCTLIYLLLNNTKTTIQKKHSYKAQIAYYNILKHFKKVSNHEEQKTFKFHQYFNQKLQQRFNFFDFYLLSTKMAPNHEQQSVQFHQQIYIIQMFTQRKKPQHILCCQTYNYLFLKHRLGRQIVNYCINFSQLQRPKVSLKLQENFAQKFYFFNKNCRRFLKVFQDFSQIF
eukprot:TRINITY_DN4272_c0_g2_i1.p1 TRINITY_DN4272_c0_g2~~TRINITY_DN4272_c0_g2_i1.p1  ORF type:complete len:261 (-),score=-4.01 TRINITY_DN4272_c0_g2_i1:65-847(-)